MSTHERPLDPLLRKLWLVTLTGSLALSGAQATVQPAFAQGRAASVGVATVDERKIGDTRNVIGQLTAATEARIATRTAGIVADVLFIIGDEVAKGATLVRLDTSRLAIERDAALAARNVAVAGRAVAESELKRAEQSFSRQAALRRSRAFSRSLFEDRQQDVARARATLTQAEAEIKRADTTVAEIDYRLTHAEIKAPFDGVVIARDAQPGAYMSVGTPVATLLDAANLEVEADVPVELVDGLTPGTEIAMTFDGGGTATARVRAVVPVQAISTRTRPVRFTADLSTVGAQRIARGKSVTLAVPLGAPRNALTVPKDALVQAGTGWQVFTVKDGKAMPVRVSIGVSAGDRVVVEDGLAAGTQVVVRGNERLRPGQAVSVKSAKRDAVPGQRSGTRPGRGTSG